MIVTPLLPCAANSGMNCATGSRSRILPCSTSCITLVVVATTLVSDARSKIVSSVIASGAGSTARRPNAPRYTTASPRPTSTTAPGRLPRAIASRTSGSIGAKAAGLWAPAPATHAVANATTTAARRRSTAVNIYWRSLGDPRMRHILATLFVAAFAVDAAAQIGRVGGTVKDDTGQPIKGATVIAENPTASPTS